MDLGRVEGADVGEVVAVHDEDEVKAFQVGGLNFAGAAFEGDAAMAGGGPHAFVGQIASVEAEGAGGVDADLIAEAGFFELMEHDTLSGGGSADVAHADEEDAGV